MVRYRIYTGGFIYSDIDTDHSVMEVYMYWKFPLSFNVLHCSFLVLHFTYIQIHVCLKVFNNIWFHIPKSNVLCFLVVLHDTCTTMATIERHRWDCSGQGQSPVARDAAVSIYGTGNLIHKNPLFLGEFQEIKRIEIVEISIVDASETK